MKITGPMAVAIYEEKKNDHLRRVQSIVEEVEEERETEGRPANSQHGEDNGGSDVMRNSRGVHHSDGLPRCLYQDPRCQSNNSLSNYKIC